MVPGLEVHVTPRSHMLKLKAMCNYVFWLLLPQDPRYQPWTPFGGVEHVYFPARSGNRVTMYKVRKSPNQLLAFDM